MTLCKAVIMGKVVRDPEKRYTTSNIPITSFSIDINNDNELSLVRVITKGKQAELAANTVKKNNIIVVEGRLVTNVVKTVSGAEKKVIEIDAQNFEITGQTVSSTDYQESPEILDYNDDINGDDLIGEDEIPF